MEKEITAIIRPNPKRKPISYYVQKFQKGELGDIRNLITMYIGDNIVSPLDFVSEVFVSAGNYLPAVTKLNNDLNALIVTVIEGMDTDGFDGNLLFETYYNSFINDVNKTIKRDSLVTRGNGIVRFSGTVTPVTEKEFLFVYLMNAHYNDVRKIYLDQNEKKAEESK